MQNKRLLPAGIAAIIAWTALPATAQPARLAGAAQSDPPAPIVKNSDRIVFIGDSITGQGAKGGPGGWPALIAEGLRLVRPDVQATWIALGGSGSTIGAWLNFEKKSRTESVVLDVKDVEVGKTLDAGTEVLVVMLGMNDILAPSLKNDPADFDAWAVRYGELIEALRARSHPRVVALATITPCTEEPASPKNQAMAELNAEIAKLAQEKKLLVLPTGEASYEIQVLGRAYQPYFHVTRDFVHPNPAGHLAIAVGMLRGLGEARAAEKLLKNYAKLYQPAADKFPALSYTLQKLAGSPDDATQRFRVKYQWTPAAAATPPLVKAVGPEGWTVNPASLTAAQGQFECTGPLDRAENKIILTATAGTESREQVIAIPAGWRIAVGGGKLSGWTRNAIYDPTQDHQALDEKLAQGDGFSAPVPFTVGAPAPWLLAVANSDYTGLNRPGSIDMAALAFFHYSDQAYGARWIFSPRERPVNLNLGTQGFAVNASLGVWLNGKPVYAGKIGKAIAAAAFQKGWNLLVFRSSFVQWQWQLSIDVAGEAGDDLADLRYATRPPPLTAPAR
jgi:lysophospholipase L1-like esterase